MSSTDLESKIEDLDRAYAGSILIDECCVIKHRFMTNPITRYFYKHFWCHNIIGYGTALIALTGRKYMFNQGILHWYIEKGSNEFGIYSIRTKRANNLRVLKGLMSEVEKIAKIRGYKEMFGYSQVIMPELARRYGWESRPWGEGFQFHKTIG